MCRYVKTLFWQPCWTMCLKNCECSGCRTYLLLQYKVLSQPCYLYSNLVTNRVVNETVKRKGLSGLQLKNVMLILLLSSDRTFHFLHHCK